MDSKNRYLVEEITHILRLSPLYDLIPNMEKSDFIYILLERYQHSLATSNGYKRTG